MDLQIHQSQLFTVRLWRENLGEGQTELRGQVNHVQSGDAHYFREWDRLVPLLQEMLDKQQTTEHRRAANDAPVEPGASA